MTLFKSLKKNGKKAYGTNGDKKEVKYVYIASSKAIFLIAGKVRESKFSYGVPIIPLYGKYRSTKDKKDYYADELKNYNVILNLPKDVDIDAIKGKKLAVVGFAKDEVYVETEEDEEEVGN